MDPRESVTRLQQELRADGLDAVAARYALSVARAADHPELVLLKYDQLNSPMREPVVQVSRGIVLDAERDWAVAALPYLKFFNAGEGHAAPLDWATARVTEKLDGTLATLYWHAGSWHWASTGRPDASGRLGERGDPAALPLRDYLWQVWRDLGYALPTDPGACYMFELVSPRNRVIVPQHAARLVLHGVRRLAAEGPDAYGELEPGPVAAAQGWEAVRTFALGSIAEALAAARELDPAQQEGYVVVDAAFRRLKVKSPRYVALHHLAGGLRLRPLLELLRAQETEEYLAYFPDVAPWIARLQEPFAQLIAEIEADWAAAVAAEAAVGEAAAPEVRQRAFARVAGPSRWSAAHFGRRQGRVPSARHHLAGMRIEALEDAVLRVAPELRADIPSDRAGRPAGGRDRAAAPEAARPEAARPEATPGAARARR